MVGALGCSSEAPSPSVTIPDMAVQSVNCASFPAGGMCLDSRTVATCVNSISGSPYLVSNTCGTGYSCVSSATGASCKLSGDCRSGQTRCASTSLLDTCTFGAWKRSSCAANLQCKSYPGIGAGCVPATVAVTARGTLQYQRRDPNTALTGYATPATKPAEGMLAVLTDSAGNAIGSALTDAQGRYSVEGYKDPGAGSQVYFLPAAFDANNNPAYAVARPIDGKSISPSPGLWTFNTNSLPAPTAGVLDAGTQLISGDNAGVIQIYSELRGHVQRMTTLYGKAPTENIVVLFQPTLDFDCLACYVPSGAGGCDVGSANNPMHFETVIALSGSSKSPLHLSASVTNHEIGHYLMDQYGTPPGEGGTHYVDRPSTPGLAWSEGFATLAGQTAISARKGTVDPVFFALQQGTSFWVDLSRAAYSGGTLPSPNPAGPIDQQVNENIVAAIGWDLWKTITDAPFFQALGLPRVNSALNRGYTTVDLVDFADALQCSSMISPTALSTSMSKYKFPWDGKPLCQ